MSSLSSFFLFFIHSFIQSNIHLTFSTLHFFYKFFSFIFLFNQLCACFYCVYNLNLFSATGIYLNNVPKLKIHLLKFYSNILCQLLFCQKKSRKMVKQSSSVEALVNFRAQKMNKNIIKKIIKKSGKNEVCVLYAANII